jgi:hypothetical protein
LCHNGLKKLEIHSKHLSKEKRILLINSLIDVAALLPME